MRHTYYMKKVVDFFFKVCSYATFIALLSSILMNVVDFVVVYLLGQQKPNLVISLSIIAFSAVFSLRHYHSNSFL